jgi:hypothetical protein
MLIHLTESLPFITKRARTPGSLLQIGGVAL